MRGILLPILLASLPASCPALAQAIDAGEAAAAGRFTIIDEVAPVELSENTQIYVDGKLVASFRLGAGGTKRRVVSDEVADPLGRHSYALCGTITVAPPGHPPETHEVDSGGMISDVAGRAFEALGAADFTFFYLSDAAPGRVPSQPSRGHSPLCHPPLS